MSAAVRSWLLLALTLSYLVAAHLALAGRSTYLAAVATALLVLLVLAAIKGRHHRMWRTLVALAGAACVVSVARGAPPVALLLPPAIIPAGIGWMFGRTLRPGQRPLVERLARGFHAPEVPPSAVLAYARGVTWAWALLLGSVALVNASMILNLSPGGLLELVGLRPVWPVSAETFVWFGNSGTYLLIGGTLLVEFAVRVWRFPDYRFRNPLEFARAARSRMPAIMAAIRDG
jgi:hypothetical protein